MKSKKYKGCIEIILAVIIGIIAGLIVGALYIVCFQNETVEEKDGSQIAVIDGEENNNEDGVNADTNKEDDNESQVGLVVDKDDEYDEVGKILLVSKDQNGDPVSNNKFTLTRADGTYIGEVTSGVTGIVTFYYVPVGEYVIELTSELSKYYSEVTSKTVTIDNGWTSYVVFTSERLSGSVQITVIDDSSKAIEGAEYTLYDAEGYVLETAVSGENGKIKFENLDGGRYYFKCTSYDGKCTINDTFYTFLIDKDNNTFYKTCEFERWKGTLFLVVTDENGEPANDISYTVYDENKEKEIVTITTNEKGLTGVKNVPAGTYYYKQDDSSDDYHEFIVEEDEQIVRQDITVVK